MAEMALPDDNQGAAAGPRFLLRGQYAKDLSFENPHAPMSLLALREPPKVEMNVNLGIQKAQENLFELVMAFSIRATAEKTLFIVDLAYGGLFELHNIPEDKIEQLLLVDCAFILFPFARRVIADATRDGGFMPLMLEPIDFFRLYQQRKREG